MCLYKYIDLGGGKYNFLCLIFDYLAWRYNSISLCSRGSAGGAGGV